MPVSRPAPEMKMSFQPKPNALGFSAWSAIALFAAAELRVYSPQWRRIKDYPKEGFKSPPSNTGFVPIGGVFEDSFGEFAHRIALWNEPATRRLLGYVQLFGGLGVGVIFGEQWDQPVSKTYCVDPLTGEQGSPTFRANPYFTNLFKPHNHADVNADFVIVMRRFASRISINGHGATRVEVL